MSRSRLMAIAGGIAWLMAAFPAFIQHGGVIPIDMRWLTAFLVFGALFLASLARPHVALLLGESAAALTLVFLRCDGYEGVLLAVVAMQLGTCVNRRGGSTL